MPLVTSALSCHEASQFAQFQRLGAHDPAIQQCILLGRFDQLALAVGDEVNSEICKLPSASNARVASASSYVGRLLGGADFDPVQWAQTHPLLGHSSLRLARRVLKEAGSFDFLLHYLEQRLPHDDQLRWAVVSGTGWEDVTVLFFGRSYNHIKRAVGVLRAVSASDVAQHLPLDFETRDGLSHLVLTSCTLPGLALPSWSDQWSRSDTETFLAKIEAEERLRWAVRVETYPGHWDAFVSLLEEKAAEAGVEIEISPLFGQADARITPAVEDATTHRGLVRFLTEVMFPLEAMKNTVVRTVETRLIPELAGYHEDTAAPAETTRTRARPDSYLEDFEKKGKAALLRLGVPPHNLEALKETLSHIEDMASDRLHGEEFRSMLELARAFIERTAREAAHPDLLAYQAQAREMQRDISDWQMSVERCLADRFRGPYPAGDSLMVRLGNHSGAHQRFLVVMDHFAQQSFDLARQQMARLMPETLVTPAALATFIGNSPSPYATSHLIRRLNCGFTDVPAHLVTRLQDLHHLAHETGHHFFRAFICTFDAFSHTWDGINDHGLKRDIREIFAEWFSSHVCFPRDPDAHEKAAYYTARRYYQGTTGGTNAQGQAADKSPNRFLRSFMVEFNIRFFAIHAWIQNDQHPVSAYEELVRQHAERLPDLYTSPYKDLLEQRIEKTRLALETMRNLANAHPEFNALMQAVANCAEEVRFPADANDADFLATCRHMVRDLEAGGTESLTCLEHLWFLALRSQDTLAS